MAEIVGCDFPRFALQTPILEEDGGGFIVRLFKDRFAKEELEKIGLNERQIKAVLYVKEKERITNKEYQEINLVAKPTATRDLSELADTYKILKNSGVGAGSIYELIS